MNELCSFFYSRNCSMCNVILLFKVKEWSCSTRQTGPGCLDKPYTFCQQPVDERVIMPPVLSSVSSGKCIPEYSSRIRISLDCFWTAVIFPSFWVRWLLNRLSVYSMNSVHQVLHSDHKRAKFENIILSAWRSGNKHYYPMDFFTCANFIIIIKLDTVEYDLSTVNSR